MLTPEGKTKKAIRAKLRSIGIYVFSPVQMGMGMPTLDDLCCIGGKFVAIEYKAEGKTPTPRQRQTMREIQKAGGIVVWGDSTEMIVEQLNRSLALDL